MKRLTPAIVAVIYAGIALLWIFSSGFFLSLTIDDPDLLKQIELIKGIAFVFVTSCLLYLLLKAWQKGTLEQKIPQGKERLLPGRWRWLPIIIILIFILPATDLLVTTLYGNRLEQRTYRDLEQVALLKAEQIELWMHERYGDALTLAHDRHFTDHVLEFLQNSRDSYAENTVHETLTAVQQAYSYSSIILVDADNKLIMTVGEYSEITPEITELLENAETRREIQNSNMYKTAPGRIYLDWIVPLISSEEQGNRFVGAVILRTLPDDYLYAKIQDWPAESKSAETLLVRRVGDEVIFLNELRHRKNTALLFKENINQSILPGAIAVRKAVPGTAQAVDYRGIDILAAYRPVAGTDWHIVAKIDYEEAMEPLRQLSISLGLVVFFAVLALAVAMLLLWRQQQQMYNLAMLATEAETDHLLRNFYTLPFIGIGMTSPVTLKWVKVNDRLCDILGYTREELLDKTWVELTHKDDIERDMPVYRQMIHGELDSYTTRKRYIRKDGSIIHATLNVKTIKKEDGTVDYFLSTVDDITAQVGTSEKLLESEQKYRELVENANSIILRWKSDGSITFLNEYGQKFFGYSEQELRGCHVVGTIVPETESSGRDLKEMIASIGVNPEQFEQNINENIKHNGERVWINWHNRIVFDDQGNVKEILSIGNDITGRKSAEDALAKSRRNMIRAQAITHMGNWEWDPVNNNVTGSEELFRIFDFDNTNNDSLALDALLERIHPDDLPAIKESMNRILIGASNEITMEYRVVLPGRETRHVIVQGEGIYNDQGKLVNIFGVLQDITERKKSLQEIEFKNIILATQQETSLDGILVVDANRKIISWNHRFAELWGFTVDEIEHDMEGHLLQAALSKVLNPDAFISRVKYLYENPNQSGFDELEFNNGKIIERYTAPMLDNNGNFYGRVWYFRDITERKDSQKRILRLNRLYKVISEINSLIVRVRDREELFREACRIAVESGGFRLAWIGMVDQDEKNVVPVAFSGVNEGYLEAANIILDPDDPLTGLPNRTLFNERLSYILDRAKQTDRKVAVLAGDLKQFRHINNALGRQTGDAVLHEIGERLQKLSPDPANVGRITSDYFAMILPENGDASSVAHLLEDSFIPSLNKPLLIDGNEIQVSFISGISVYPIDGENAETLYHNAEAALKKAKTLNVQYLFYQPEMTARVAERLLFESKLRKALDKEQFVLHYQPKVSSNDHIITGLEALIRWNDPESGLVPPGIFIPLLEETGMILNVGKWAIDKALADAKLLQSRGITVPKIAVNVSSMQLLEENFVDDISRILQQYDNEVCLLDMEVTESLLMQDIDVNIKKLAAIRELGVNIAIDDFGTGHSSLSYLARLPINALKIDRSFISTMDKLPESMTIVSSIITLAHAMDLKVVAEGVETEGQSKLLRLLKCDEMQGYLFSKPLPVDEIAKLLRKSISADKKQEK